MYVCVSAYDFNDRDQDSAVGIVIVVVVIISSRSHARASPSPLIHANSATMCSPPCGVDANDEDSEILLSSEGPLLPHLLQWRGIGPL